MTNKEAYDILTNEYYIGDIKCEKAVEAIRKAAKALKIVDEIIELNPMGLSDILDEEKHS